jgi:hypothetical protein
MCPFRVREGGALVLPSHAAEYTYMHSLLTYQLHRFSEQATTKDVGVVAKTVESRESRGVPLRSKDKAKPSNGTPYGLHMRHVTT